MADESNMREFRDMAASIRNENRERDSDVGRHLDETS
jgi:hypothetical protein